MRRDFLLVASIEGVNFKYPLKSNSNQEVVEMGTEIKVAPMHRLIKKAGAEFLEFLG